MFATILLVSVIIVGFIAGITLGSQAYFLGEMSKPIHERNWNSDSFEQLAESITGQKMNEGEREPGFEVGDAFGSSVLAQ